MAAPQSVRDGSDYGQPQHANRCPGRLYVMGYLRGPRPGWLDCERPLRVLCRDCDFETRWACSGHRETACRPCSSRYRRRVRSVANSGMYRADGYLYLLTLTAPGDEQHAMPSGAVCECTPAGGVDLPRWNAGHSKRWNHFRTLLRRDVDSRIEFFRGVEVQVRGALHDHAMVWSPVPLDVKALRNKAIRCGFGHSVDLAPCAPGSKRAAHYVSKYVTKACDSRDDVPWWGDVIDYDTGELTQAVVAGRYRTWSMSRGWGKTMGAIRAESAAYAQGIRDKAEASVMSLFVAAFGAVEVLADESPPMPS